MGQAPRPRYDHCAELISSHGNLIIYGGRNYDLFEISGKISLGDIFVLNLNFMVWCNVKIISGKSLDRFDFISFQHGETFWIWLTLRQQTVLHGWDE